MNWIKKLKEQALDAGYSLVIALIIALLFRTFLFEPYKIPSGSMFPNLLVGDYLFVSKYSYGYSKYSMFGLPLIEDRILFQEPKRGDIIVFKHTKHTSMNYIKRLIGLPGEEIQLINGILHINGVAVPKIKIEEWKDMSVTPHNSYPTYNEHLPNGVTYRILEMPQRQHLNFLRNTMKYKVPPGHYFFMGDNRDNSIDSRFKDLGFVPKQNLIGQAKVLFWTHDLSLLDAVTKFETGRTFTGL